MNCTLESLNDAARPSVSPPLDAAFRPAALWRRAYREQPESDERLEIALLRPDGTCFRHSLTLSAVSEARRPATLRFVERTVKFLLWQRGAARVLLSGPQARPLAGALGKWYSQNGDRAFDANLLGKKLFGATLSVEAVAPADLPAESATAVQLGGHLSGYRIGFDLGGSDRKVAAIIDGKVVFSEEIEWNPYFQTDASYHYEGIMDSLRRAAAHLPRVDAIGGSAAGVYVNNEVRVASLFRGIPEADFATEARPVFRRVAHAWGDIPFEVVNDGEVTALAGAMSLDDGALLGVAMGTSLAAGYCDTTGSLTPWLNELAFAPLDYAPEAPADEWSGDRGCGVQYLSQQAVGRLLSVAGIDLPETMPLPERLKHAQERADAGDERAGEVFRTVGAYFGYAVAHFAEFYVLRHVMALGRVMSGEGGGILLETAAETLARDFPELGDGIGLTTPDETMRRHGQAVAAASLPAL